MAPGWVQADGRPCRVATTPSECGERRRVVSRRRHSGRGCRVVACSRPLEMREDPCNDGGVLDRGDQLHPASAARTAQDVEVGGPAHQRRPRPVAAAAAGSPRSSCGSARAPGDRAGAQRTRLPASNQRGMVLSDFPLVTRSSKLARHIFPPRVSNRRDRQRCDANKFT